jgi:hypothetical protein
MDYLRIIFGIIEAEELIDTRFCEIFTVKNDYEYGN